MRTATPSRLECLQCGAWTTSNVYALPPEGNDAAEIMLVGEGAGQDEELYGRNFIGRAGDMLNHCLAAAGILLTALLGGGIAAYRTLCTND